MVTTVVSGKVPATWTNAMEVRFAKLQALRAQGINPYRPTKFQSTHTIADIHRICNAVPESGEFIKDVKIAGRIITARKMGKVIFAHIEEDSGRLQIFLRKNDLGEEKFNIFKDLMERGDFVGVSGNMFRTKTGEITLEVKDFDVLCKALRPLPDKWGGIGDEEVRQRQRYLDLASSPEVRERFRVRSRAISLMRRFFEDEGTDRAGKPLHLMEVETPVLQEIHGGANARPFVTHHNTLDMALYLRIATELHLKRLIVGGFGGVYEIGKIFRNEGISTKHNPEFTSMEVYWAYRNYEDMMALTEDVVAYIVKKIHDKYQLPYQGQELDFTPPWKRMTMEEAVEQVGGVPTAGATEEQLREAAALHGIDVADVAGRGLVLNALFENLVEKKLVQPTFVYRYPTETSPLCKRCPDDPNFIERFELYIVGMELANAYSELNDPIDQRARFEEQVKAAEGGDEEAQPFDEDFIQAIEVGMPPTGGLGIGIDRLAMLLTNSASIRDVVLFPTMRKKGGA